MAIVERKNRDGSYSYRAKVRDPEGKWYRSNWFKEKHLAVTQEADLLKQKRQGKGAFSIADAMSTTVDEYWDVWSVENRPKTSEGWKISQNQMYRDYIKPVIGKMTMYEIGAPDIGRVLNRMRQLGRSEQMTKHVYSLLRKMFGDAVGYYRMIPECPVNPKFHRPDVAETESAFLHPAQAWTLLKHASNEPAVWLETLAGMRTEATVALKWECVLWETNQILIRRAWKSKVRQIEERPKGRTWEYIPMVPPLRAYLWERWQACKNPQEFVCQGPRGGMLKPETYAPRLKRLCRAANVPQVSPHILRHSCSELFVREGATQVDIQRLLNHKNASTTRRYMHRSDERLNAIAGRVQGPELRVVPGGNGHVPTDVPTWEQKSVSDHLKRGGE